MYGADIINNKNSEKWILSIECEKTSIFNLKFTIKKL
jgi:hypothetical protein